MKSSIAILSVVAWCLLACGDNIEYIAHQGEEALAPSHSRAAYRLAVEHGLDWLKLDVRETKDGHVVLQHDATLKATMGWDAQISGKKMTNWQTPAFATNHRTDFLSHLTAKTLMCYTART